MDDRPQDATRHAGQVVRRMLLRRNIAVDPETAQLVADAVQAALQPAAPSRPQRRRPRGPAGSEPLSVGVNQNQLLLGEGGSRRPQWAFLEPLWARS